jgi:hypothetical protein
MSSSTTDPGEVRDEEFPINEVLLICVTLVGALVGLLILRFLLNVLIDALILGDMRSTRRSCLVIFCCCSSVGSPPDLPRSAETRVNASTSALPTTTTPRSAPCSAEGIEVELSRSKASLLSEILPGRAMTQGDWKKLMASDHQSIQSTPGVTLGRNRTSIEIRSATPNHNTADTALVVECSICLQSMNVGMLVHETDLCGHMFHAHCIREWLVGTQYSNRSCSFNNHCPNCRTRLVDPALRDPLMAPEMP